MSSWTAAAHANLMALVARGLTAAEIGKRLGMTKNAVMGRLHRTGENERLARSREASSPQPQSAQSLLDRFGDPKSCRWIEKDPRDPDWSFCGKPTVGVGQPYCAEHHERAWMRG